MSIVGVQVAAARHDRIADLESWERTLLELALADRGAQMTVVGHGHRIATLAGELAEECRVQREELSR